MKALSNSRDCPRCGGNHKAKPFCVYGNGYYCFSCGFTQSLDRSWDYVPPKEISNPDWPEAISNPDEFPLPVRKWLVRYNITNDMCKRYNIMSCPDSSVIYPNLDEHGELISYQRRWLDLGYRKIITKGKRVPTLLYNERSQLPGLLVLVEDFVSYMRVAEQYNCLCLWGTSFPNISDFLAKNKQFSQFIVWLDNDEQKQINSGQIAAKKICNNLDYTLSYIHRGRSFQTPDWGVHNLATEHDPKQYVDSEIRQFIEGVIHASIKQPNAS